MASNAKSGETFAETCLDAGLALLNSGKMQVWSGTIPTNCEASDAGDGAKLATLTMNATAFASAGATTARRAIAGAITSDSSATGGADATHVRFYNAAESVCHLQCTAGEAADSTDITFDDKTIAASSIVACSSFYCDLPVQ